MRYLIVNAGGQYCQSTTRAALHIDPAGQSRGAPATVERTTQTSQEHILRVKSSCQNGA